MIQWALLGAVTPEEKEAHQWLKQEQCVKKKGMAIQMPTLNTTFVEVH